MPSFSESLYNCCDFFFACRIIQFTAVKRARHECYRRPTLIQRSKNSNTGGVTLNNKGSWFTKVFPKVFARKPGLLFWCNAVVSLRPFLSRCQAKFLTYEISDFTPCEHAQSSNILHVEYAEKTDD